MKIESMKLKKKCVKINKENNESMGMRIGGGLGSNEGEINI